MVRFEDVKERIRDALRNNFDLDGSSVKGPDFTLVEGFFNPLLSKELTGDIVIGGPSVPMVAILHNNTGELRFFALKALVPNL